ncbi:MAG: twin-arginine translocase TatA/TatE family subunit [Alphaproteobacteria bacterium]
MGISIWQILVVLLIVLILFGAGKLPRVMGDIAKGVKSFKSGLKDDEETESASTPRSIEGHGAPQTGKVHRDETAKS